MVIKNGHIKRSYWMAIPEGWQAWNGTRSNVYGSSKHNNIAWGYMVIQ